MKRVLCLSDIHAGSIYGLLPPNFVGSNGQPVEQNAVQKYFWQCWLDNIAWATQKPLDAIVVLGDVVDGKQGKSHGAELCLTLMKDQEQACEMILEPLLKAAKCKKLFFVKGTFYHDDEVGRSVDNVGKHFKGETQEYDGLGIGVYAKEVLDLEIEGVVFDFSHGISVSGGLYRAVAIDREALWSAIAGKTGKAPKADVIVRAHAHYFVHVEHPSKHAVILPAWQAQTSYMRKNSRYRMIPDIGSCVFTVDGKLKELREDPCHVSKRIYELPPGKVVHL